MKQDFDLAAGKIAAAVDAQLRVMGRSFTEKLWRKDATAWNTEKTAPASISNWLGWLDSPRWMIGNVARLEKFSAGLRADGFTDVVLLGMGGSSLAPIVLGSLFKARRGFPKLHVLDSTDPGNVAAVEKAINLKHSLFIVASKSGTTIEPNSFYKYFRGRVKSKSKQWAKQFVAITDENTALHKEALADGLRDVFVNPSDIGGRYSALSYFGLVPAACIGIPVRELLEGAVEMAARCGAPEKSGRPTPSGDPLQNPGFQLGVAMGVAALDRRDKLTLVVPKSWSAFGLWVEQLIAESTGKEGKGIIPIAGEELGAPESYGNDRFFVQVRVRGQRDAIAEKKLGKLRRNGSPVAIIEVDGATQIGAEFFRWEIATATAGAVLGINPFDQPNVQLAKDRTNKIISQFTETGKMVVGKALHSEAGISIFGWPTFRDRDAAKNLSAFLRSVKPNDYVALLAYLPMSAALEKPLQQARLRLRDARLVATTFGYGPRYLHSTGQLHKGGANNGVFLVLTATPKKDLEIPNEKFTFAELEMAQALGDAGALEDAGRRVLRLHLDKSDAASVKKIGLWISAAIQD